LISRELLDFPFAVESLWVFDAAGATVLREQSAHFEHPPSVV